ncbi:MAG: phosphoribosylglycinamide formyltransferase [Akkermansia sp.]|nr:phosphoribosylglycinamide formyltransferase [Akkermansia sp.]
MRKVRLAIMGSGSGTNCQSIFNAIDDGRLDAEVVLVLSDHADARILERARQRGVPAEVMDCAGYKNKFPLEEQERVAQRLTGLGVDMVCLAGFMRLVKEPLLRAFPNRILNIHPALLPNFPGVEAWTQALHAKVKQTGCTVHYVDAGMDSGEIIMQAFVPVLPDDTPETLHARIQVQEHILYPAAILSAVSRLG